MSPIRLLCGLVLLAMGVLAILDAAGTVAWSDSFEEWWPLAIVGWGAATMITRRRLSLGGSIIVAIGFTLLADEQGWTVEALVWSVLFLLVGAAVLFPGWRRRQRGTHPEGKMGPSTPAPQV